MTNNKQDRAWKRVTHFIWSHPRYIKSQWMFNKQPITRLFFDSRALPEEVTYSKDTLRAFCEANPQLPVTFVYEKGNNKMRLHTVTLGKLAEMFEQSPSGSYTLLGGKNGDNWLTLRRMNKSWQVT